MQQERRREEERRRQPVMAHSVTDDNGNGNGNDNDNDNGPDSRPTRLQQLCFLCASAGFVALSVVPWHNAQAGTGSLFFTPPWPPFPPPLAPQAPPPMLVDENGCLCENTCNLGKLASNGHCDDGGPQSVYSFCALGYDCTDCGGRCLPPPSPPRLPPLAPLPAHPPRPPSDPRGLPIFKTFAEYMAALFVPVLSTSFLYVLLIMRQCCVRNQGETTRGEVLGAYLYCVLSTLALIVIVTIGYSDPNFEFPLPWPVPFALLIVMAIPLGCLERMAQDRRNRVLRRVNMIEGDLLKFLADRSIRLVSVKWLLSQPPDWIAVRRQVGQATHQL